MFPYCWPKPLVSLLCLLFVLPGAAFCADSADSPISQEYVLRVWDVSDGLPNNHVSGLAQTPDGYVWIATWWGGLVRFDGVKFTPITIETNPQTDANRVHTVFVSRDGTLWIGLERGGVARRINGQFEMVVPPVPATESTITTSSFAEDSSGGIWFAYNPDQKVFRLAGNKLSCFSIKEGLTAGKDPFVHADANAKIWFSARDGCGVFEHERFRIIDVGGLGGRLTAASGEGMWAVRRQELMYYHSDGTKETVAQLPGLEAEGGVNVLYKDREGNLWIGTRSKGLFRFRQGQMIKVPTSHSTILSIMEDREGNILVGTEAGLNRLHSNAFSMRQTKDGLLQDSVVSLCLDSENRLWLAGRNGSLVRAVDASNRSFAVPPGWGAGAVMAMYSDPEDGVWLGILGELVHWQADTFLPMKLPEQITALQKDTLGDLWISKINGELIHRHQEAYERIPTTGGLILPRALAVDSQGKIWVGTEAGRVFRRGETQQFSPVELPNAKPGEIIRFIVPDGQETVWIGSFRGGLYRWRNGQVLRLPQDVGLPLNDLRSLIIGPEGDFWFGAGQGLFRVQRTQLEAVLDGAKASLHCSHFGREEGVPTAEFTFGFRGATARTADGHIWFATYSGALEIDPERLKQPVFPVPVLIEDLQCGEGVFSSGSTKITLAPNPGPIQIHYTEPQLSSPDQVRFRYRLSEAGETPAWIDAGGDRSVSFPRIAPGNYRFEVASGDSAGNWSASFAFVEFTVRAAWWETGWFRILGVLAGSVILSLLVRFLVKRRMQTRIRRLEQEHALERERARIARDMHDQLGANLTQVALFTGLIESESAGGSAVADYASQAAASANDAINALDEIVWAVNPRNDNLASLLEYLGQRFTDFLHAARVRCVLELPKAPPKLVLSAEYRHHLFLMVQETLNNAIKHAKPTEVSLKALLREDSLVLEIADDGPGFSSEKVLAGSDGLINMRERAEMLGGSCSIQSQPGQGTTLRFDLPLPGKNATAR